MRVSVKLLVFFILLNGWAGLLQNYHIDDHIGINAEVGNHPELETAQESAQNVSASPGGVFGSTVGMISTMFNALGQLVKGLNPAAQMLTNIAPGGVAEALILWAFGVMEIFIAVDLINFTRGVG